MLKIRVAKNYAQNYLYSIDPWTLFRLNRNIFRRFFFSLLSSFLPVWVVFIAAAAVADAAAVAAAVAAVFCL